MNQEEAAFTYLRIKFSGLNESKLKEGIFIGHKYESLSRTNPSKTPSRQRKGGLKQF